MNSHKAIQIAALLCIAVTSAFLIYMSYLLTTILSARDWCFTAIGADKVSTGSMGSMDTLTACVGLLTLQIKALSLNSHIVTGTMALALAVLVIVVLANARVQGKVGPGGAEGSIGGNVGAAVDETKKAAAAVVEKAEKVEAAVAAAPESAARPDDPA